LHDPYNTNAQYFDRCEQLVDLAVQVVVRNTKNKMTKNKPSH